MEEITCSLYKSFPLQREVKRQKIARTLIGKELEEQSKSHYAAQFLLLVVTKGRCLPSDGMSSGNPIL